jgi:hypothetical protein
METLSIVMPIYAALSKNDCSLLLISILQSKLRVSLKGKGHRILFRINFNT